MLFICFGSLLCLGCNLVIIGDTYVVYWFSGCCLFASSLVRLLLIVVVWFKFVSLRSWGCNWSCSCFLTRFFLDVFFWLLRLCRVGVMHWQLELFVFHFVLFRSYNRKWTCGSVIFCVWRSRDMMHVPCPPILLLNFAPIFFPSSGPYLHAFAKCSCRRKGY
jgi:hypothetical protein